MDNSTTVLLFLALLSLWCFFYWRPRRKIWAAARLIPGPKSLPLIGNVLIFWGNASERFTNFSKIRAMYGNIVRVWLGNFLVVVIADPEDIKSVFVNPRIINRDSILSLALEPFTGVTLFTSENDEWKMRRKMMTPMFHYKVLESHVEIFGTKAKILVEKLEEVADGKPFDINKKLFLCVMDGVSETVIGVSSNIQKDWHNDCQDAHFDILRLALNRVVYPWQLIPWLYPLTIDGQKAKEVIKTLVKHYGDHIPRKLAAYRQGDRHGGVETESGKIVPSFLDMLIEASESQGAIFTEKEIYDEVLSTASAGHITLSITISTLLILISIHPEWQDTLFAEMTEVFADDMTRPATNHDLSKMPVLDRVLRETLRMFPIVGVIVREITEDIVLPSGYTLPAGSSAVVLSYFVHREPKNYPEPHEYVLRFLPDRWLPGSGSTDHTYAYLPFGAGPRHCLGQKYSLLQMKSTISQMVRHYKMDTDFTMKDLEKLEMEPFLRLQSGGYQLKLEKRAM